MLFTASVIGSLCFWALKVLRQPLFLGSKSVRVASQTKSWLLVTVFTSNPKYCGRRLRKVLSWMSIALSVTCTSSGIWRHHDHIYQHDSSSSRNRPFSGCSLSSWASLLVVSHAIDPKQSFCHAEWHGEGSRQQRGDSRTQAAGLETIETATNDSIRTVKKCDNWGKKLTSLFHSQSSVDPSTSDSKIAYALPTPGCRCHCHHKLDQNGPTSSSAFHSGPTSKIPNTSSLPTFSSQGRMLLFQEQVSCEWDVPWL